MLARTSVNATVDAVVGKATAVRRTHRCVDAPQFVAVHHFLKLRCAGAATTHRQISTTRINDRNYVHECNRSEQCCQRLTAERFALFLPARAPLLLLCQRRLRSIRSLLHTSTRAIHTAVQAIEMDFRPHVGVRSQQRQDPCHLNTGRWNACLITS